MNTKHWTLMGLLVAAVCLAGCAAPHVVQTAGPNAGITITSSTLAGGPYANGEIKVIANNTAYGTKWCPYQGTPPANPIWRGTATGPDNPGTFAPGQWFVMLKANQPVNFASNPVSANVVAGCRTRISVTYP